MDIMDYKARLGTPPEFIERLRTQLALNGISHAAFARTADVCPTQVSRWFSGRVLPSLETMIKLDSTLTSMLYDNTETALGHGEG